MTNFKILYYPTIFLGLDEKLRKIVSTILDPIMSKGHLG